MKTNEGIIHYGSKADYMAKRPTASKLAKDSSKLTELIETPAKVELSDKARESSAQTNLRKLPEKVKAKAQESVKAGKHLLDGAGSALKKALNTPGLSNLMPNLGGAEHTGAVEIREGMKTLHQPAVIFINGFDLNLFDSETGLDTMSSNIPRSKVYNWDQEEEVIARIRQTDLAQPVIIVGQGMGGDTAVEISSKLNSLENGFRKVDMLITLDSIGFDNDIIPQNVKQNFNVISDSDLFFNDGPNIARNTKATVIINELRSEDGSDLDESNEVQFMVFDKLNGVLGEAVRNRNAEQTRIKSLVDKILPS